MRFWCSTARPRWPQPEEAPRAVIDAVAAAEPAALRGRNVITAWLGEHSARAARQLFADARIATYETPDSAVAGFMHRVRHQRNQELLMETPPARPDRVRARSRCGAARHRDRARRAENPGSTRKRPAPSSPPMASRSSPITLPAMPDEAAAVAATIGFPVALKIRSPDITHKTDVGGVALDLGDAERVRRRRAAMLDAGQGGTSRSAARRFSRAADDLGGRAPSSCSSGSSKTRSSGRWSSSARAAPRSRSCGIARSSCRR